MRKKLAILAIAISVSIILGGFNSIVIFTTDYLTTKIGYNYSTYGPFDWWDCNWSYAKKIIIHHEYIEADQTNFPVLIYRQTDSDLRDYAQSDGDDIAFVNEHNTTQLDHEIEQFQGADGKLVAWVEVPSLSSTEDTILYISKKK